MTVEEKLHKEFDWLKFKHVDPSKTIEEIVTLHKSICQQAVDERNKKIIELIDNMIKQLENVAFLSVSMDRREAIPNAKIQALTELKEGL